MNSFYITLPSNACRNRFPNNTQANFTTMLDTPIELNGVFEVALAEIDYSTELSTEMGKLELTSFIRNIFGLSTLEELVIDIEMKNRITISDFTKQLDSLLSNKCTKAIKHHLKDIVRNTTTQTNLDEMKNISFHKYKNYENGKRVKFTIYKEFNHVNSRCVIIDTEDSKFSDFYLNKGGEFDKLSKKWKFSIDNFEDSDKIKFDKWIVNENYSDYRVKASYDSQKNCISFTCKPNNNMILKWTGNISYFFFKKEHFTSENKIFVDSSKIDMINYVCVYTDIIDEQYYGDIKAQILKMIVIKPESNQLVTNFENLHYVRLKKKYLHQINIELRDLSGRSVKFLNDFAFVVIKLHLRKVDI